MPFFNVFSWTNQNADDVDVPTSPKAHGVRTALDEHVSSAKALEKLKEGNSRFVQGMSNRTKFDAAHRQALAMHGQNPFAAVIGCADSRCPLEILFDCQPGDLFVLRNAGNTCTHAEGSMVGSVEYSVSALGTNLILVLGHTKCGAIAGATKTMMNNKVRTENGSRPSTLDILLKDLGPVAMQAEYELKELKAGASVEEIAEHAVKVNVYHTMEKLLSYSEIVRERVKSGDVQIHGAIYDIVSGRVEFLGQPSRLPLLLGSHSTLVPRAKLPQAHKTDEEKQD